MKRHEMVLAAGVALAGGSAASTDWRGGGYVSEFENCEGGGRATGHNEAIRARYRPSGLPGNGNASRLTFLFNNGNEHYQTRSGRFASQFSQVDGVAIWSGA